MKKTIFTILLFLVSLSPALAAEYVWTGTDCQTTNNAAFSNAGNWMPMDPFAPPTPTPGPDDTLIFNQAYKLGSCTNNPFDDISATILGQWAEWGNIYVDGTFDGIIGFSNFGALTPVQDPLGQDADLVIHGDFILAPGGSNSYGVKFSSSTTTNRVYYENARFDGFKFDYNNVNPWEIYGGDLAISDPFQFEYGALVDGCLNTGTDGGFNMANSIRVDGVNMIDCYYEAPTVDISPGVTNIWTWSYANNDVTAFLNSNVYFATNNTISSDYEIDMTHNSNELIITNSTLIGKADNQPNTFKIRATHGDLTWNNAIVNSTSLFIGSSADYTIVDSNYTFNQLFFDQGGTTTWTNSDLNYVNSDGVINADGLGYNPLTSYNINLDLSSPVSNTLDFYPTDLSSDWNYPAYNITSNNVSIRNSVGGEIIIDNYILEGTGGFIQNHPGLTANVLDASSSSGSITMSFAGDLDAAEIKRADNFTGTTTGNIDYFNVTYTSLPTFDSTAGIRLDAGGTPHTVRGLTYPPEGSTVIEGLIPFNWTQEWGVDGYECEVGENGDNFNTPVADWSRNGETNTSYIFDTSTLTPETAYQWRCRSWKVDQGLTNQTSIWSDVVNFFYLYSFNNTCFNSTIAIDLLDDITDPTGTTPRNETLFTKIDTPYTFVVYNASDVKYRLQYFDGFFNRDVITDSGSFSNSVTILLSNDKVFDSPLSNTQYNISAIAYTANGSTCETPKNFYAVAPISPGGGGGGGSGNVSVSVAAAVEQAAIIWLIEIVLILLAVAFFILGIKASNGKSIILEPGQPRRRN